MKLGLAVRDQLPQDLTIRIRGADVLSLEPHAGPDVEAPIPDLGQLVATAARRGLFAGPSAAPWKGIVEVLARETDPASQRASWTLRLRGVDRGALRVIANVLRARELDEAVMTTVGGPDPRAAAAPLLDVDSVPYPGVHGTVPFVVERETPERSTRDRVVQVVFRRPPPDAVADELLGTLETWTELLMLGGYPEDGMDPAESGAFPEPPFQLDELTVEQSFPELFAADDAAFDAIVNVAHALHHGGHAVAQVVVR